MRQVVIGCALVVAVFALLAPQCAARDFEMRPLPPGTEFKPVVIGERRVAEGDTCVLHDLGFPLQLPQPFLLGDEIFKILCVPGDCPPHSSPYNGVRPYLVEVPMVWFPSDPLCTTTVVVDIEHPVWIDPDCPFPGEVVWQSEPFVVGPFEPGYWVISFAINDTPCLAGPFFVSIHFLEPLGPTCDGIDIAAFNAQCVPCTDYNDYGFGWADMCVDYDFLLAAYVYAEWSCDAIMGWIDLDGDEECGPDQVILPEVSDALPVDVWLDSDSIYWNDFMLTVRWDPSLEFVDWIPGQDLGCGETYFDPISLGVVALGDLCLFDHGVRMLGTVMLHNVQEDTEDMIWIESLTLTVDGDPVWQGSQLDWCPGFETTTPVRNRSWGSIKALYR